MKQGGEAAGRAPNAMWLLGAGFMAILAAGVGFAIRGGILDNWGREYGFSSTEQGMISGAGFTSFCIGIILGGFVADRIGYMWLVVLAFVSHVASAIVTFGFINGLEAGGIDAAEKAYIYQMLYWGTFLFGYANGTLEAVANPLVATLFPDRRTHYLNILHASWPAGLIIGGALGWVLDDSAEWPWQWQLALFLLPTAIYGLMFVGQSMPKSEASKSGMTLGGMMKDVGVLGGLVVSFFIAVFFGQEVFPKVLPLLDRAGLPVYVETAPETAQGTLIGRDALSAGAGQDASTGDAQESAPAETAAPQDDAAPAETAAPQEGEAATPAETETPAAADGAAETTSEGDPVVLPEAPALQKQEAEWQGISISKWLGYIVGGLLLVTIGVLTRFSLGSFLLFILFITHAMVGAVELGTDNWIQNITGNILTSSQGKFLFVYTSAVMFGLRFCAHFIETKIGLSPVGLLLLCAILAIVGLQMTSYVESFAFAVVALTIYGVGKTFFWPTMLAVASDRFPKTGAVAISIMGGIGMMSAGLIGAPGLGYLKDKYSGERLSVADNLVYEEFKNQGGSSFLFFPKVYGLDGEKLGKVNDEIKAVRAANEKATSDAEKQEISPKSQMVAKASIDGDRDTLRADSLIPATMAVIYLLLVVFFKSIGGYKPLSLNEADKSGA